jgi:hypothetical protein
VWHEVAKFGAEFRRLAQHVRAGDAPYNGLKSVHCSDGCIGRHHGRDGASARGRDGALADSGCGWRRVDAAA